MTTPPNVIVLPSSLALGQTPPAPPPPVQRGQSPRALRLLALNLTLVSLGAGLTFVADQLTPRPGGVGGLEIKEPTQGRSETQSLPETETRPAPLA